MTANPGLQQKDGGGGRVHPETVQICHMSHTLGVPRFSEQTGLPWQEAGDEILGIPMMLTFRNHRIKNWFLVQPYKHRWRKSIKYVRKDLRI